MAFFKKNLLIDHRIKQDGATEKTKEVTPASPTAARKSRGRAPAPADEDQEKRRRTAAWGAMRARASGEGGKGNKRQARVTPTLNTETRHVLYNRSHMQCV